MRKALIRILAGTTGLAAAVPCLGVETPRLPTFALLGGRTGDALTLGLPPVPDLVPLLSPGRLKSGRSGAPPALLRPVVETVSGRSKVAAEEEDDDDDEETKPAQPGTLPTSFVKVPAGPPTAKNSSLGPHLRPDIEFTLNERTSLGLISQLDGVRASTLISTLGRLSPLSSLPKASTLRSSRSRDLGLGASIEFKLGQ